MKRPREDSPPPTKRRAISIQQELGNFCVKTTPDMKDMLDIAIVKFFLSCNIPFSVAEHPHFFKAMNVLRPGFSLLLVKPLVVSYLIGCMRCWQMK